MRPRLLFRSSALLVVALLGAPRALAAQDAATDGVPKLAALVARPASDLAPVVERYTADRTALARRYDGEGSPRQRVRMRAFYAGWRARLREVEFGKLNAEGKADWVLLDNHLVYQLALLDRQERQRAETAPLMPFADGLLALHDARRELEPVNAQASAHALAAALKVVDSLRQLWDPAPGTDSATRARAKAATPKLSRTVANRGAVQVDELRATLRTWYRFYDGYDPIFTWWNRAPYAKLDSGLIKYARTLREKVVGIPAQVALRLSGGATGPADDGANDGPIIGDPIGNDGLKADLAHEMIPYTADELIAIAEREYAFSLSEIKKAAREMGFGDDWKKAMDKVKDTYVEPGKQPELIRSLARQAEQYFAQHDWVTIPQLATEDWRMEMLSPERQKTSPFFLGGDLILVSYPTVDMADDDKLMSLRGNNPHFSHATVFHELNPGHHLQGFMQARYNQHRRLFGTPFWNEGQSLYWEMFLWDRGFHASPEDRIGALFWRMHRSARIIFSLNFHIGKMTPEQAVQFLVDTVNFERANAEAEVRRSFNGTYPPLYQAGYMLGGLEIRALYKDLVSSGRMTDRQFHDAILEGGAMPIAMVRARLAKLAIPRDGLPAWRFAEQLPPPVPWNARR
jgi:hypothetical protein